MNEKMMQGTELDLTSISSLYIMIMTKTVGDAGERKEEI